MRQRYDDRDDSPKPKPHFRELFALFRQANNVGMGPVCRLRRVYNRQIVDLPDWNNGHSYHRIMLGVFSGLLFGLFGRSILVPIDRHAPALRPEYAGLELPVPKIHPVGSQEDRIGIGYILNGPL